MASFPLSPGEGGSRPARVLQRKTLTDTRSVYGNPGEPEEGFASLLEVERVGREYLFGPDLYRDDLLAIGILDKRLDSRAVRRQAKG